MKIDNIHVSFVIPAYNCANTLEESVDSIFNRNFEDGDEVIIVNDGSTDETAKIIDKIKNKRSFIISIKNEVNKGCPASRNIGINKAKNSLIFNLDSDNILSPNSIAPLKKYLLSEKADVAAFSEYHYFKKNPKQITHKWVYEKSTMTLADFLSGPINPGPGGNFLYTKASWQKIEGYWEYGKGLHEAWGFTLKQLANGAKFVVLRDSFYFHRYGHDSLFTTESKKKSESSLMATRMILNFENLLNAKDLNYIKSEEGSNIWFEDFYKNPVRLKTGEIGVTGYKINLKKNNSLINKTKMIIRKIIRTAFSSVEGKLRYQSLFEKIFTFALRGMNYGGGSKPEDSGEINVLRYIKNKYVGLESPVIIFDVGANIGGYTLLVHDIFRGKKIKILSFEPSGNTFKKLQENARPLEDVSLFNFGFGKNKETLPLFSDKDHSGLASLYDRKLDHFNIEMKSAETIEVKKIDDFCLEQNINHIHFLKLDIEGNEFNALSGTERMMREDKIDYIQFEFGGSNIDSKTYFQDFFYLLNPKYKIFRIVKDGLYPINVYKETLEVFTTTNYLAEKRK